MRFISDTNSKPLKRNREMDARFGSWLKLQVEDAISKRFWLDSLWRENLRQYEATPALQDRESSTRGDQPPVIEIPIGATQTDTLVSAVEELVFNTAPPITVKGSPGYEDNANAFQMLIDKLRISKYVNFRPAIKDGIADSIMMGTGAYYPINQREIVKRARFTELNTGPRVYSIPPEDLVVPGGSATDVDSLKFIGHRNYYNEAELNEAAKANNWRTNKFKRAGNVDWVRLRRENLARTDEATDQVGNSYEVFSIHCYYDYDSDGYAEDLHVIWDRTSYELGAVAYAPYDSRPYVISRYQWRPHLFYGIGVMEMARQFQLEVTEWHNFKMKNAHLANARMWAYKLGAVGIGEEFKISPNKAVGLGNPKEDLVGLAMADMYASAQMYEQATLALAEQRVGTSSLNSPTMSAGKRTPANTAMAILQQQNRRFASPFDNMRTAISDTMLHCVMRLREKYLSGGINKKQVIEFLVGSIGPKNAQLVIEVYEKASEIDMRDCILIEVTASSTTVNKEADKQANLQLVSVMGQYYQQLMQLAVVIYNPQSPPELQALAMNIAKAGAKVIEKLLRTFDTVRDPDLMMPQIPEKANAQQPNQPPAPGGNVPGQPEGAGGPEGASGGSPFGGPEGA